jgi:hypothetical protein
MQTVPIRILLVEDDPADVDIVRRALSTGIQAPFDHSSDSKPLR